jgi:hypothetical protein
MTSPAKRILYIELNTDGTAGGSHQCLFDLVRHLDRDRFTPVVLFYQDNRFATMLRELGVEVHVWNVSSRTGARPIFPVRVARGLADFGEFV